MRRLLILAALLMTACSGSSSSPTAPSSPTPAPVPTPAPAPTPVVRGADFNQTFWNEFVHNGFEQPGALQPLRRLTSAPMLYLKTVDEAGVAIDAFTLQTVEDAARSVASIWSGGQFSLVGVQRGTGTMQGQRGWLTVIWPNPSAGAFCGFTDIALDGGVMRLNYLRSDGLSCGCNGAKMRPRTVRHELGHAFGYYHTDNDGDVMKNGVNGCGDAMPSAREIYHATIAYQSAVGTTN